MIKWVGILASIVLLAACGSDGDEESSDPISLSSISGSWEIDVDEGLDPTAAVMKYLSIKSTGEAFLYGLDPVDNCYLQDTGTVINNGDNTFNTAFPQGNLTLSLSNDTLKIDTGMAVVNAEVATQDFNQFNLCGDIPEPPVIVLEDIQGNWEITELEFSDGEVALHYFNISEENILTSYHLDVDQNCHKMESVGKVNYISNGHFSFPISTSQIMINYEAGQLKLYEEGSDQFIYASNTSGDFSQLAICGQVAPEPEPEPEPDPIKELTLTDLKGIWVYQADSQSHYVSIGENGLFKRFALDDVKECYNHLAGSVANKGNNQFAISPAEGNAFIIELSKDGDAFQSSSPLGEVEFNRSNLTEDDLTPECTEPVIIDEEMTLLKLQGSFGGEIDAAHRPFSFVAGSLLSFVSYDFPGGCYQRQGYWLEELGEGQFKKTEVLTGDTETVGFISEGISVSLVNINTGLILELGDYNSAGDYPETGSNHLTSGVNLLGCININPVPSQLVGYWYSDSSLSFIKFHITGEQLIRTKYPYNFTCHTAEEPKVISDASKLNVFSGNLAMKDGSSNYYNRVLEKDLPLPCDDSEPDLTLTLEDIAGLWASPLESGEEFYYDITIEGAKTLYTNVSSGESCLSTYSPTKLTRLFTGRFTDRLLGLAEYEVMSFLMPSIDQLFTFSGHYDRKMLKMERANTTLEDLNSRVCEK